MPPFPTPAILPCIRHPGSHYPNDYQTATPSKTGSSGIAGSGKKKQVIVPLIRRRPAQQEEFYRRQWPVFASHSDRVVKRKSSEWSN